MKAIKNVLAGIAAAGLVMAPIAQAQAQDGDEFEESVDGPKGSGPLIAILIVALLLGLLALAFEKDNDPLPTSP
jgi:hypothetical protein